MPNPDIDPFVHSIRLEMDWETDDDRMNDALEELLPVLETQGKRNVIKRHLRALLIMCARLHRDYPDGYMAYSRNNNFDRDAMHYNPLRLKMRGICRVIDALGPEYIESHSGFYWSGKRKPKRSRLKPAQKMIDILNRHDLCDIKYHKSLIRGGIILKDSERKIISDYDDSAQTHHMRKMLLSYNSFIESADIGINLDKEFEVGFYEKNRTYRVFTHDFNTHGRFYGGWWCNLKKWQRRHITINGFPTVELDYKSNHLCFLYALEKLPMPEFSDGDPYNLSASIPRGVFKRVFILCLNTLSQNGSWFAMKNQINDLDFNGRDILIKNIPDKQKFDEIVSIIKKAHPVVDGYFYRRYGLTLMNLDSQIAEFVLMSMMEQGIICLGIHDSFIVQKDKEEELRRAMHDAYDAIGYPLALPIIEKV